MTQRTPEEIAQLLASVRADIEAYERGDQLHFEEAVEPEEYEESEEYELTLPEPKHPEWKEDPPKHWTAKLDAQAFAEYLETETPAQERERKGYKPPIPKLAHPSPAKPNGHDPAPDIQPFKTIQASSFAGLPIPEPKYLDGRQTVPIGHVTLMTGSGGIGKTIIALQLAVGCAAKANWLGYPVNQDGRGAVVFYSGEEPRDVIHRHIANICQHEEVDLRDLTGLHIIEAVEEEGPGLFTQTKGKTEAVEPTLNFRRLKLTVELVKPDLIVIDNRGQVVEGDENKRVVAHQTMGPLTLLARRNDSALALLAHPSMTGENTGTGQSGSTAWYAAARSQLNMTRPKIDGKDDMTSQARAIEVRKNQYENPGAVINILWHGGCYKCTDTAFQRAGYDMGRDTEAENSFLFLTGLYNTQKLDLSPSPSSPNYAPKVFSSHPKRGKLTFKDFDKAFKVLLEAERVVVIEIGPRSKHKKQLVVPVPPS